MCTFNEKNKADWKVLQLEYAVQYMLLMSLHNIHFRSLKEGVAVWAFEGKVISPVQGKLLYFVGWRLEKNGTSPLSDLSSQALSKMKKNGEMFHVSCLFLPKAKKEGKRKLG